MNCSRSNRRPETFSGARSPACGRQPHAAVPDRHPLVAEAPQGPLGQPVGGSSVGPDHPPPGDAPAVPGHHRADLARAAATDHLGEVAVRGHRPGRHGLDEAQDLLDEAVLPPLRSGADRSRRLTSPASPARP